MREDFTFVVVDVNGVIILRFKTYVFCKKTIRQVVNIVVFTVFYNVEYIVLFNRFGRGEVKKLVIVSVFFTCIFTIQRKVIVTIINNRSRV